MKWEKETLADRFYLNPNIQIFPYSVSRERSSMGGESQSKAGAVPERETQRLGVCRQKSRPKGLFFIKSDDFQAKHSQCLADLPFRHAEDGQACDHLGQIHCRNDRSWQKFLNKIGAFFGIEKSQESRGIQYVVTQRAPLPAAP
jgi:hypothetical protein